MRGQPPSGDNSPWWADEPGQPEQATAPLPLPRNASMPGAHPSGPMPAFPALGPAGPAASPPLPADVGLLASPGMRSPRARRRQQAALMVAPILLLALLAAFILVLRLPDGSAQPVIITQANAGSTPIQAYITGAVVKPGVYTLHSGDRVYTLLEAAGGPTSDADLACVNLAAPVADGEEVYVPHQSERPSGGAVNCTVAKLNINSASADEMRLRLAISLATAQKIVAYRNAHGAFTAIEQLIPVVGLTIYNRIKDLITV